MSLFQNVNMKLLSLRFSLLIVLVSALVGCKTKPPRANFIFKQENGGIVHFTNTSAGQITRLNWKFGDGGVSDETSPTHRYLAGGTYTVTLTVENEGGSNTFTSDVVIDDADREAIEDYPTFPDAEGYFYARNRYEFDDITPDVLTEIKASALVTMYDTSNFLVSVGEVKVNGIVLNNNSDNTYSYHSLDSSWYFKEGLRWVAEGGNNFPTVVENIGSIEFPEISAIVSPKVLVKSIDTIYSLRVKDPIVLADSVMFRIESAAAVGDAILEKTTEGGFSGVAFTEADILKLTPGEYITKVIAYSYERKVYNFKPVYFTKESYTESTLLVR